MSDEDVVEDETSADTSEVMQRGMQQLMAKNRVGGLRAQPSPTNREEARLGHFTLQRIVGRGGMGVVFRAWDERLGRMIALKLLRPEARHQAGRLLREARALAKVNHPNVVSVHEVGTVEGQAFIAMELVEGLTLRQWQEHARPTWRQCVRAYIQAGRGLSAAHAEGIIHRDFKPDNCLIDAQGQVRVVDFGLARGLDRSIVDLRSLGIDTEPSDLGSPRSESSTHTGTLLGTIAYMSSEQLRGLDADERSDQFAFCVGLYEALYRTRPYPGRSIESLLATMRKGPVDPERSRVPAALRRAVLRGLAFEPAQRWPSMEDLLGQLEHVARPRWRRWLGVVLSSVVIGGGLAAWHGFDTERPCQAAKRHLEGIWDDEQQRRLQHAVLETHVDDAEKIWERARGALDAYTEDWISRHTEICEAARIHGELSLESMELKMVCLEGRLVRLRESVGVVAQSNTENVVRAMTVISNLPSLDPCDDVESLRAWLPSPEDSGVAAKVAALREKLARAEALRDAARLDESLEQVEQVVASARSLDYGPLLAEAWLAHGTVLTSVGRVAEAKQMVTQAYSEATATGHVVVSVRAANTLAFNLGHIERRFDEALAWNVTATALSRHPQAPLRAEARALHGLAVIHQERGEFEQALEQERRALERARQIEDPADSVVASILNSLGSITYSMQELDTSAAYFEESLAILEQTSGPRYPFVGIALSGLGKTRMAQIRVDEAFKHFRAAVTTFEEVGEHYDVNYGPSLLGLGDALRQQGHLREALDTLEKALRVSERMLGPSHRSVGAVLNSMAMAQGELGDRKAALESLRRAASVLEEVLEPDDPDLAAVLINLGHGLASEGQLDEAEDSILRAQEILARAEAVSPMVGGTWYSLGTVSEGRGQPALAIEQYTEASKIFEDSLPPTHRRRGLVQLGLARAMLAHGEREAARIHAQRAVDIAETGSTAPDTRAAARFILARTMERDPENRTHARELALHARDDLLATEVTEGLSVAEIDAWLEAHPERSFRRK